MTGIQYRFSPYVIRPSMAERKEFSAFENAAPVLDFSIGEEYLGTLCQEFHDRGFQKEPTYGSFLFGVKGETSPNRHHSRSLIGFPGTVFRNMCDIIIRRFDFETQDMSEGTEILRNATIRYSDAAKSLMLRLP